MPSIRVSWAVAVAVGLSVGAYGFQGGGHQQTPAVNRYIVAEKPPMPTPGQFAQTGLPTVMRRAQSTSPAEYGVAFSGAEFQTPSSTRAVFYGVGNVASPTLTKMVTVQTLVTTSVAGSTGPTVAIQDVGNLIAVNDSDAIAALVTLPSAAGLSPLPSAAVVRRSLTGSTELLANINQTCCRNSSPSTN